MSSLGLVCYSQSFPYILGVHCRKMDTPYSRVCLPCVPVQTLLKHTIGCLSFGNVHAWGVDGRPVLLFQPSRGVTIKLLLRLPRLVVASSSSCTESLELVPVCQWNSCMDRIWYDALATRRAIWYEVSWSDVGHLCVGISLVPAAADVFVGMAGSIKRQVWKIKQYIHAFCSVTEMKLIRSQKV